jgi:hypothetical protein
MEWQSIDYLGTEIRTVDLSPSPIQFSYTVTDGYVLISNHPSNLKAALDCAAGHTANLSEEMLFQEFRARVPEKVNQMSYTNLPRFLDSRATLLTEELSTTGVANITLMKPISEQSIDLLKVIIHPFVGLVQYTVKDGNGLRGYSEQ